MSATSSLASTQLLRLVTAGSVDDGKSTLIGRLLYDTKQILVDQLEHIEQTSQRRGDGYVNLALLTDGLRGLLDVLELVDQDLLRVVEEAPDQG